MQRLTPRKLASVRGQKAKANPELEAVIHRNSMHAAPRARPFRGLPLREGELSRRWGARAPSGPSRTMEA